jgi:hypothetical protein
MQSPELLNLGWIAGRVDGSGGLYGAGCMNGWVGLGWMGYPPLYSSDNYTVPWDKDKSILSSHT